MAIKTAFKFAAPILSAVATTFISLALREWGVLDPSAEAFGMWLGMQTDTFWWAFGALVFILLWGLSIVLVVRLSRQSDAKALNELEGSQGEVDECLGAEAAARHFRDLLSQNDQLYDLVRIFDEEAKKLGGGSAGVIGAFRFWWPEGFSGGRLAATGIPNTGNARIPVHGPIADDYDEFQWQRITPGNKQDLIELPDGQTVASLEFKKSSVTSFVDWLASTGWQDRKKDTSELKSRLDAQRAERFVEEMDGLRLLATKMHGAAKDVFHSARVANDPAPLVEAWQTARSDFASAANAQIARVSLYRAAQDVINRCDILASEALQPLGVREALSEAHEMTKTFVETVNDEIAKASTPDG